MGIYDRPYYSDESEQGWTGGPLWNQRMVVTNLVLLNVAFFVLNLIFGGQKNLVMDAISVHGSDLPAPWFWWRFLSYAFAHDPNGVAHILFNMLSLWFLGRSVELHYGRAEFLRIYLIAATLGGIVFATRAYLFGIPQPALGASGAVICVTMLFVFLNPKATLMIYGVLPMPAWVLGGVVVVTNFLGGGIDIAYDIHITGIVFAAVYFFTGMNFGNWLGVINLRAWKRRLIGPSLKLHDPEKASQAADREDQEADRILQKIFDHGQDSLTAKEKRFMEKYSLKKRKQRDSNPT